MMVWVAFDTCLIRNDIQRLHLNETVLIRKAQGGDSQAFRMLVDRHAPIIWTVINRMAPDVSQAEDLFQETTVRFWRGLPNFNGSSKLSTWLYSICYRVCLDAIEKSNSRQNWVNLDDYSEDSLSLIEDSSNSGHKLENELAARDLINKALAKLNPEWRGIIILYYWRELTIEEISKVTGRPVNTIKVYLHRARSMMRKLLEKYGYPSGGEGGF